MNPALLLKAAPWVLLALAVVWAGLERNGRQNAVLALSEQKNQYLEDANKTWRKVADAQEAYDAQVAAGLAKLNEKQRQMEATIEDYRKAVAADPGGKVRLTPAELAALRMLASPAGDKARGGAVSGADAPSRLR